MITIPVHSDILLLIFYHHYMWFVKFYRRESLDKPIAEFIIMCYNFAKQNET